MQQERQTHNKIGDSGFYHFYGVVEDRKDPKKLGRVRVRCFGEHNPDLTQLPTEELVWAKVILPLNVAPNTALNLWDGQLVFGFFADGIEKQVPVILGAVVVDGKTVIDPEGKKMTGFQDQREKKDITLIDGKSWASTGINASPKANPDNYPKSLQKKARDDTLHGDIVGELFEKPEPDKDPFAGKYPFVHSQEFESGHILEFDDTPGEERIHIFHRTGTYIELLKDGSVVYKSIKDKTDLTNENSYVSVLKDQNINIEKNKKQQIKGQYDLHISGGDLSIDVTGGDVNLYVNGNVNQQISGNLNTNVSGSINYTAGGRINMQASSIHLND